MERTVYLQALERLEALESRQWNRLRDEYLVRHFGGNDCRRHNCLVNFDSGVSEGPGHAELARLAREYEYKIARHRAAFNPLRDSLWRKHVRAVQ